MATVIKSTSPLERHSDPALRAVAFKFNDIAGQADNYLETVRDEAAKIIQEAHQEAESIRQQSADSGRQAALEAAHKVLDDKVAKQMKSLTPAMEKAIREIEDAKNEWLSHWERSAVSFATAIASRIIRREIEMEPEIKLDMIREALSLAAGAKEMTLHLSEADYRVLGSQVDSLTESLSQLAPADIVADATIQPGGCRVVTEFGEVDHRIESQLERIIEELTG